MNNNITFVLLLGNKKDIDYAKEVQLKSVIKYVKLDDIDNYIIITKKEFINYVKESYKDFLLLLKIRLINEEDIIIDYNINNKLCNYSLQMFLKLAIYKYINTDTYITLDSDIYLINHFCKKDIYYNNKIKYDKITMNIHTDWWKKSCEILKYKYSDFNIENGFGVTPSILKVDIVKNLNKYILNLNSNLYNIFLLGITEYTLYWLYTLYNKYDIYYINNNIDYNLMNYDKSVWFKEDIYKNKFDYSKIEQILIDQFNEKHTFFNLFQSTTDIIYSDKFIKNINKYLM